MKKIAIYTLVLFSCIMSAQERDKALPTANEEYNEKKFVEAEANYRISHSKFPNRIVAPYNLGNSIYKQKQAAEAKFAYLKALEKTKAPVQKHKVLHNLGNAFMLEKDYAAAVEAYKNALRNKPSDEETRYNYALAKKMLKENPPKQDDKKKDKNKDQNKDQNQNKKDDKKDEKNKDKDGDKKPNDEKGDGKNGKNDEDKGDQGKPKPRPGGINQQRTENLLDAVNNGEKKIQEKVNGKKIKGKPVDTDKDW